SGPGELGAEWDQRHEVIPFIHGGPTVLIAEANIQTEVRTNPEIILPIPAPKSPSSLVGSQESQSSSSVAGIAQEEISQIGNSTHTRDLTPQRGEPPIERYLAVGRKRGLFMEHLPKLHVSAEHHGVPPMRPGQIILILLHHVRANDRTIVGVPDTCEVGQTKPRKTFVGRGQSLEIGDPKTLHETLLARTF